MAIYAGCARRLIPVILERPKGAMAQSVSRGDSSTAGDRILPLCGKALPRICSGKQMSCRTKVSTYPLASSLIKGKRKEKRGIQRDTL